MIFGINTTRDISKLLYVISRAVRRVKILRQFWNITSGIYAKYHVQIMLLFVYTTTRKRFVIFTCRYFTLSWNTAALGQSNCRNFSCSSIKLQITCISGSISFKHNPLLKPLCNYSDTKTKLVGMIFASETCRARSYLFSALAKFC